MKIIEHFVEGTKYSGNSKRTSLIYNPATGETTAKVKLGSSEDLNNACLLYTSPSPRDPKTSRMPSSA